MVECDLFLYLMNVQSSWYRGVLLLKHRIKRTCIYYKKSNNTDASPTLTLQHALASEVRHASLRTASTDAQSNKILGSQLSLGRAMAATHAGGVGGIGDEVVEGGQSNGESGEQVHNCHPGKEPVPSNLSQPLRHCMMHKQSKSGPRNLCKLRTKTYTHRTLTMDTSHATYIYVYTYIYASFARSMSSLRTLFSRRRHRALHYHFPSLRQESRNPRRCRRSQSCAASSTSKLNDRRASAAQYAGLLPVCASNPSEKIFRLVYYYARGEWCEHVYRCPDDFLRVRNFFEYALGNYGKPKQTLIV